MAMVALYRPGPMEVIPEYIKRKQEPSRITFPDPRLEEILQASYGLLVYQDDVLMTAITLAGYDWSEADKFRKAMGKKIPAEMAAQKEKFYKGCKEYGGLGTKKIDELWKLIEPFAAYGFNKAHAASYGMMAYKTAYLKANYPAEYMSACMTAESGDIETCSQYIQEARRIGFTILPPDVNESFSDFTVVVENGAVTDKIRFGLRNIKNFGEEIGKAIIEERKVGGAFTSIENFLERVQHRNLNKKSLEALIMCGAMDSFGERGELLANIENLLAFHKGVGAHANASTFSLFDGVPDAPKALLAMRKSDPATLQTKLSWEKELLGLYVSGHPLDTYGAQIAKARNTIESLFAAKNPRNQLLVALIDTMKIVITKNSNNKMAFLQIEDKTGSAEAVVFPETFKELAGVLKENTVVALICSVSNRNDKKSFLVEKAKMI
jgi:DNA polymerase-3 subunit alpha